MLGQLGDDLLGGIVLERAAEGLAALFPQQQHHEVEHLASPGFGDSDVGELGCARHRVVRVCAEGACAGRGGTRAGTNKTDPGSAAMEHEVGGIGVVWG